jgi:hypothetical protein
MYILAVLTSFSRNHFKIIAHTQPSLHSDDVQYNSTLALRSRLCTVTPWFGLST